MKKLIKNFQLVAFAFLLSFLTSCVYSLFPIYTEDTLVFKPELLGKWESKDDYIVFEQYKDGEVKENSSKTYRMTVKDQGKDDVKYIVHLVEIGNELFMDLYPIITYRGTKFGEDNVLPVHSFMKIDLKPKTMDIVFFDLDKLNKLFESNLIRLRHENVDGTILITAQPKELQKFLEKYSKDESVYDYTETYSKVAS